MLFDPLPPSLCPCHSPATGLVRAAINVQTDARHAFLCSSQATQHSVASGAFDHASSFTHLMFLRGGVTPQHILLFCTRHAFQPSTVCPIDLQGLWEVLGPHERRTTAKSVCLPVPITAAERKGPQRRWQAEVVRELRQGRRVKKRRGAPSKRRSHPIHARDSQEDTAPGPGSGAAGV